MVLQRTYQDLTAVIANGNIQYDVCSEGLLWRRLDNDTRFQSSRLTLKVGKLNSRGGHQRRRQHCSSLGEAAHLGVYDSYAHEACMPEKATTCTTA